MTGLNITDLRAGYGKIQVLRELSLSVQSTDYVAVVGANGAGKTTLLKAISGTVAVQGVRWTSMVTIYAHARRTRSPHWASPTCQKVARSSPA